MPRTLIESPQKRGGGGGEMSAGLAIRRLLNDLQSMQNISHVKGKGGWRIANGELVKLADL